MVDRYFLECAINCYPEYAADKRSSFYGPSDYQPIIDLFGKVVLQIDDNDYQGDSRVLYKNQNNYGYLHFGWGSCSGCDSLQACNTIEAIAELIKDLHDDIIWWPNAQKALEYFLHHDWTGDFAYYRDEQKAFIDKAKKILYNETIDAVL